MSDFPLAFKAYAFPHIELQANSEHKQGEDSLTQFTVEVEVDEEDEKTKSIAVSIALTTSKEESKNTPYFFKVHCIGIFVRKGADNKRLSEQVYLACKMMIVGSIREMLADISSRSPWGTFILQPLSPKTLKSDVEFPEEAEAK